MAVPGRNRTLFRCIFLPCYRCSAVLLLRAGAHRRSEAASMPDKSTSAYEPCTKCRSTTLQRFEHGNTVEIRNGILFDFYLGLPHIYMYVCEFLLNVKRDISAVRWFPSLCSVSSFCKYVCAKTAIGFFSAEGIQTVVMYTAQTNIANSFHNYTKICAF